MIESLLVLTIPIVARSIFPNPDDFTEVFDELVSIGFPIVVVDHWSDITKEKLHGWWAELAPRLEGFRAQFLTAEGYWRFVLGHLDRPPTADVTGNASESSAA